MELLKTLCLIIAAVLISSIQSSSDESLLTEMKESLVAIKGQCDLLRQIYAGEKATVTSPKTTTTTTTTSATTTTTTTTAATTTTSNSISTFDNEPSLETSGSQEHAELNVVNNIRIEYNIYNAIPLETFNESIPNIQPEDDIIAEPLTFASKHPKTTPISKPQQNTEPSRIDDTNSLSNSAEAESSASEELILPPSILTHLKKSTIETLKSENILPYSPNLSNHSIPKRSIMVFEGPFSEINLCVNESLTKSSEICHTLVDVSNHLTTLLEVIQKDKFDESTLEDLQDIKSELQSISTEASGSRSEYREVVDRKYGKELYINITRDIKVTIDDINQWLEPPGTTDQWLVASITTDQSSEDIRSSKAAWLTLTVIGCILLISALSFGSYMYYQKSNYNSKSEHYDSEFQPSHVETVRRPSLEESNVSYTNEIMLGERDSD